jgi:hypothetical protein
MKIFLTVEEIENLSNDIVVLLDEEYGYQQFFWFPKVSETELIKYWKNLAIDPISGLDPFSLSGDVVFAETSELISLFRAYQNKHSYIKEKNFIMGYFEVDDGPFLRLANGETIFTNPVTNEDDKEV